MTAGTPPAASSSSRSWGPLGRISQRCGVLRATSSKVLSGKGRPASLAMASRCRTVLDEPPRAMSTVIAFSNASRVRMSEGFRSSLTKPTTLPPLFFAILALEDETAKAVAHPGSDRPMDSATQAMVLAVYIPLHEPHPGKARSSICLSSSMPILPADSSPTASKIAVTSTFLPLYKPERMGPPVTMMEGMSSLAAAIIMPGVILSQFDNSTTPSN